MISTISLYIFSCTLFYSTIISIPSFANPFYLPKLIVLQIGTFILLILEIISFFKNKRQNSVPISRFHILLFCFALVNTIVLFISKSKTISFFGVYGSEVQNYLFVMNVIMLAFFYSLQKPSKIPFYFFIAGTYINACFILYQHFFLHITRPNGLEGHPIWSSGVIAMGLILTLIYLKLKRIYRLFSILPFIAALIVLDSTTTWIGLLFAFIGAFLLRKKRPHIIIGVIGLFVLILSIYFIPKEQFSLQKRTEEYKTAFMLIQNKGIPLFGYGQNTSGFLMLPYRSITQNQDKEVLFRTTTIHNQFLETLFSTGIIGLIVWIVFFYYAFQNRKRNSIFHIVLFIFLFLWQIFYYLPLSLYFVTIILLGSHTKKQKNTMILTINTVSQSILITLVIIISYSLFLSFQLLRAEVLYINGKVNEAIRTTPYNDYFLRISSYSTLQKVINCTKKPSLCATTDIQYHIKIALNQLKKAVEINPLNPENWNAYGSSLFQIAHITNSQQSKNAYRNRALTALTQAVNIEPHDPLYLDNLGLVYADLGQYDKAIPLYTKALEIDPHNTVSLRHLQESLLKQHGSTQ